VLKTIPVARVVPEHEIIPTPAPATPVAPSFAPAPLPVAPAPDPAVVRALEAKAAEAELRAAEAERHLAEIAGQRALENATANRRIADLERQLQTLRAQNAEWQAKGDQFGALKAALADDVRREIEGTQQRLQSLRQRLATLG
jgi:exonuclease VII large subunit